MIEFLLIYIIPILIALISWNVFEWFSWSRSKSYRLSRWEYYKSKISFVFIVFIITYIVALFIYFQLTKITNTTINVKSENIINNNPSEVIISKEEKPPIEKIAPLVTNSNEKIGILDNSNGIQQLTKEEIFELEVKAQYHGDDPIVRKRLGLPPKID